MKREWAIPLLLGALTATALWFAVPGDKDDGHGDGGHGGPGGSATSTSASGDPAIVLPFEAGRALAGSPLTFIVLAPHGQDAALRAIDRSVSPLAANDLAWQETTLAIYTTSVPSCGGSAVATSPNATSSSAMTQHCDPPWAFGPWPLPKVFEADAANPGALLGVGGHNGTRITVHVFGEGGALVASNAPENETALFAPGSRPERLPGGVWYVGANATAPNGTRHVPSTAQPLFEQLKPAMQGLPVGGVASVRSDTYASLYGVLYVTVRIEDLVYAP